MRLLMLSRYDHLGASSRLRMLQYIPSLEAAGIEVEVAPLLGDGYVHDLYGGKVSMLRVARSYVRRLRCVLARRSVDVLWIEKELWPWVPACLEIGAIPAMPSVIVDYDDAVFHRYDRHRFALVRWALGAKIDAVMCRADLITAGNDYLAGRARTAGAQHVERLPTVIDLDRYPAPAEALKRREVVIGWIGSPATAHYLRDIAPSLDAIASRAAIRCIAIGARADQVAGTPFEAVAWSEETEVAMLGRIDIGVMPLLNTPWEQGKCGYKLIQYMACGLPVVASPVGVNAEIVEDYKNGFLADSRADWEQALFRLVSDCNLRRALGATGRRRVIEEFSVQAQAPRLISMVRNVAMRGTH